MCAEAEKGSGFPFSAGVARSSGGGPSRPKREPGSLFLALETSQRTGSVAVRDESGRNHAEALGRDLRCDDLLSAIDRLFARARLSPGRIAAVGVSVGPGGFTGLRTAVATAKMLAETTGAALVPVPSGLVAAEAWPGPGPIVVALASKRGTAWAAALERRDGHWAPRGEPGLVTALDLVGVETVLADEHLAPAMVDACRSAGVTVTEPVFTAETCLAVAERLLGAGGTTDALHLSPVYARPPEAVSLWERRRP